MSLNYVIFLGLRRTVRSAFTYDDDRAVSAQAVWSDSQDAPNRRSAWGNSLVCVWVQRICARTEFGHVGGAVTI